MALFSPLGDATVLHFRTRHLFSENRSSAKKRRQILKAGDAKHVKNRKMAKSYGLLKSLKKKCAGDAKKSVTFPYPSPFFQILSFSDR
jgi:hypothetical protein